MNEIKQRCPEVLPDVMGPVGDRRAAPHAHPPIPSHSDLCEPSWWRGSGGSSLVLTAEACHSATQFAWWSTTGGTGPTAAQNLPVFSSPLPAFSQWVPGGDRDAGGEDVSVLHMRACQQWGQPQQ